MAEKLAGKLTGETTTVGRPVYELNGEAVSELSSTISLGNKFINVPSIHDGVQYTDDELVQMLKDNKIEATGVFDSLKEAVEAAKKHSDTLLAKGGMMNKQMKQVFSGYAAGGLYDEGGTVDPVSGNDVPVGSMQEEVRDDIPAQLSEGEFIFPADVVRYIGLEKLMQLRQIAKSGLTKMDAMGQMGNSEEATMSDSGGFDPEVDSAIDEFEEEEEARKFAVGGYNPPASFSLPDPMKNIMGSRPPLDNMPIPSRASRVPSYADFMGSGNSGVPQYETKQFIGPNNEMVSITFINGSPTSPIPSGFKPYDGQPIPTISTIEEGKANNPKDMEDRQDDERRAAEDKTQYESHISSMNRLASLSPEFKSYWDDTIQGQASRSVNGLPTEFNPLSAISETVKTASRSRSALEDLAKKMGLDIKAYETPDFLGFKSFDEDRLLNDLEVRSDPKFVEKTAAQSKLKREDYQSDNMTDAEAQTQMEDDLDEIADGIDRDDMRGSQSVSYGNDDSKESDDDTSKSGDGGYGYNKGGLLAPKNKTKPKRKTKMKRGGLASKK